MAKFNRSLLMLVGFGLLCATATSAFGQAAGPLLKLLQSGRLPKERQPQVVEMVINRGGPDDLAYIFEQAIKDDGFPPAIRRQALAQLADAAKVRKVQPSGDLSAIKKLLAADAAKDPALVASAIELAGLWKVPDVGPQFQQLAANPKTPAEVRTAAIKSLVAIGDPASKKVIRELATTGDDLQLKLLATAELTAIDMPAAAEAAGKILPALTSKDDPGPLLDAFLTRKEGADKLAAALAKAKISEEAAKINLRYMYSVGRSDAALSEVLSKAANIALDAPPPTQEEALKIAAEVMAKGNIERGEKIFRRKDLSCIKCHSIAQAGGQVGPELTALGSISPADYIVNSILNPKLAIKEQYVTRVMLTADGGVVTGIVIDRDDTRVRVRDASGKVLTIPTADIEDEAEGKSLMPQGLTKFLTHDEFIDLARFVSELGKAGPYAVRTIPTMQKWQVLKSPAPELLTEVPNVEIFREKVLDLPASAWVTAYAMARGDFPLAELAADNAKPQPQYLQGQLNVVDAGEVEIAFTAPAGSVWWLDAEPFEGTDKVTRELTAGLHRVTIRVPSPAGEVRLEVRKPSGSAANYTVVGGQ
ncbi:HEAT repeat domain-containing protein [Anatilimnocola floriformis]|uniref:HEAT repeat domain-containing protein n=1 Tax=Anatilimnocola floriformis TaxID=2948575 RepID=UPI0020C3A443|nr:HEAT repeat domain-containing protein [Anatilimnocola floriformis]